jgi:hypothetical protein
MILIQKFINPYKSKFKDDVIYFWVKFTENFVGLSLC